MPGDGALDGHVVAHGAGEVSFEYEGVRRLVYGDGATFVPVCPHCGRFVKADESIRENEETGPLKAPDATCAKCGRVEMPFEGYVS